MSILWNFMFTLNMMKAAPVNTNHTCSFIPVMLWLFVALLFPIVVFAQDTEKDYKVYDVKNSKMIGIDDLVLSAGNFDIMFFGEEHNDPTAHVLELKIFQSLYRTFPKTALSMEMFYTDVQPIINEYLSGCISERNFVKEARAWNNYEDYKPLLEFSILNKLPVIAANAAARYSNMVTRDGLEALLKLPPSSLNYLPSLPIDTATGKYYEKFKTTLGNHNMGGMKIYQTQNLWDATMAWSILNYLKKNRGAKILHLNGRFHSDEKLGIPDRIYKLNPNLRIMNISCFSTPDFNNPDWLKYKDLGDYIILTNPDLKRTF